MSTNGTIGVVFDIDGVLVDSAKPHLRSWQQLANENGTTITAHQVAATFGRQNRDIVPTLFGDVSDARLVELSDRKEEIYRSLIQAAPPIVEGAIALVSNLHNLGVRLAVGSSGPLANIKLVLGSMGVAHLFSAIVSSQDVQVGKPDPQVFLKAADRLELSPDRCVVIEDAPAGVEAAIRAGSKVIAVLMHHPRERFADANLIVGELADLTAENVTALLASA